MDFPRDVETQENDGSEKAQKKQLDRSSREWWISGRKMVGKLMGTRKEIALESGLYVEIRMEKGSLNAF